MSTTSGCIRAILLGFFVLMISLGVAEFMAPSEGYHVETKNWPVEAKEILKEQPGVPLTKDQWRRLQKIMGNNPNWPTGRSHTLANINHVWYIFILIPWLCFLLAKKSKLDFSCSFFIFIPNTGTLIYCLLSQ